MSRPGRVDSARGMHRERLPQLSGQTNPRAKTNMIGSVNYRVVSVVLVQAPEKEST